MVTKDLHPPRSGPGANPVLYGIAAGLAQMFPPVDAPAQDTSEQDSHRDGRDERCEHDGE